MQNLIVCKNCNPFKRENIAVTPLPAKFTKETKLTCVHCGSVLVVDTKKIDPKFIYKANKEGC